MAAQKGSEVTLHIGDGGDPESFSLVGGLLNMDFSFSTKIIDSTNILSGQWRDIIDNEGQRSITIDASGRYMGSTTENQLRIAAFTNKLTSFEIHFGSGDVLSGTFKVMDYNRSGAIKNAESYSISLESSGEILYTEA